MSAATGLRERFLSENELPIDGAQAQGNNKQGILGNVFSRLASNFIKVKPEQTSLQQRCSQGIGGGSKSSPQEIQGLGKVTNEKGTGLRESFI